jgi:hypothetical protein
MDRYGVASALEVPGAQAKIRAANLDKYGVANQFERKEVKEKIRETLQEKYGVDHAGQAPEVKAKIAVSNMKKFGGAAPACSEEIMARMKATNIQRYGVENVLQDGNTLQKARETLLAHYGVTAPSLSPEIRAKQVKTLLEHYGVITPLESPEILARARETTLQNHGVANPMHSAKLRKKLAKSLETPYGDKRTTSFRRISKLNRAFAQEINNTFDLGGEIIFEKNVGSYSYDLYIPSARLLIDLNPTVTHNSTSSLACLIENCETPCSKHSPVSQSYHFKRALTAQAEEFKLIQIYDWDEKEAINRLLAGKLERGFRRLSARKCKLEKIDQHQANIFLKANHFQGASKGQKYCYGLFYLDQLVAVATFSGGRFGSKQQWEFNRYAVEARTIVHGGAERLFQQFIIDSKPSSVTSYIDFNHSTGPIFLSSLGFVEGRPTGPALIWHYPRTNQAVRETSLLSLGADRLLGTSYGTPTQCGLTNDQIMEREGFVRVFTAGNRVFQFMRFDGLA